MSFFAVRGLRHRVKADSLCSASVNRAYHAFFAAAVRGLRRSTVCVQLN